eukprot:TRINITY_DN1723_c0_g1_i9.p1 TRINITY_DN1723_c0_g1~~TRINITY_DN1723_c0_g1_i9.p1  ORF type:complete len:114 (-),score=14.29 TRINITY_DN1723_c0_g1_i9:80-421(-)
MLNGRYFVLLLAAFPLVQSQGDFDCAAVSCPTVGDPWCCNESVEYTNSCLALCSNGGTLNGCKSGRCPIVCIAVVIDPQCCFKTEFFGSPCNFFQKYGGLFNMSEVCEPGECS